TVTATRPLMSGAPVSVWVIVTGVPATAAVPVAVTTPAVVGISNVGVCPAVRPFSVAVTVNVLFVGTASVTVPVTALPFCAVSVAVVVVVAPVSVPPQVSVPWLTSCPGPGVFTVTSTSPPATGRPFSVVLIVTGVPATAAVPVVVTGPPVVAMMSVGTCPAVRPFSVAVTVNVLFVGTPSVTVPVTALPFCAVSVAVPA